MTKKYLVELRDKYHIVTAEKIERGGKTDLRILKPRDDDAYRVEEGNYHAYWTWLKDEKSILLNEVLDLCFIYPSSISPAHLIETVECIKANLSPATEISISDAKKFLQLTGRKLNDTASDGEKTLLYLASGDELCATTAGGNGLATEPETSDGKVTASDRLIQKREFEAKSVLAKEDEQKVPKHVVRKKERSRPKAFSVSQAPIKQESPPSLVVAQPQKRKKDGSGRKKIDVPHEGDTSLPKATADDIQIGIKKITEDQCRDVDFRD